MLTVHGFYSPQSGVGLWAEDPMLPVGGGSEAMRIAHPHPFAARLAAGSGDGPAAGGTATLLLPSGRRAPLDSPDLLRASHRPPARTVATLRPWTVPVMWLPRADAPGLLTDLDGAAVRYGASVHHLAAIATLAVDLVDRGRVLPIVDLGRTGGRARWRPVLQGADVVALQRIVAAMPPVARSQVFEPDDRAGQDPHVLVSAALDSFVDAAVRSRIGASREPGAAGALDLLPPRRGRARARTPAADLLAAALTSASGEIDAPDADLDALAGMLASWDEVGAGTLGPARLTIRLVELARDGDALADREDDAGAAPGDTDTDGWTVTPVPGGPDPAVPSVADPAGPPAAHSAAPPDAAQSRWRLDFLLQSTEDPSLLLPAEQIWQAPHALAHWVADPQELLLSELGRAGRISPDLRDALNESRPTSWELDVDGAFRFLSDAAPALDSAGFGVLLPSWWRRRRTVSLNLSAATPTAGVVEGQADFGQDSLAAFRWEIAVGEAVLTDAEMQALTDAKSPLIRLRGMWVAADPEQLRRGLEFLRRRGTGTMSVAQVLALAARQDDQADLPLPLGEVSADGVLGALLAGTAAEVIAPVEPSADFTATLRPYQHRGLAYLAFMSRVGLGACLADDMGLGKTIQLLALETRQRADVPDRGPTLLICPMSVVGNWQKESEIFAPALRVYAHHGPGRLRGTDFQAALAGIDLVVTTYGTAFRDEALLSERTWDRVVLDEAQVVKNSASRQAAAVRRIPAGHRIALTGTPMENRLAELWAIMDFLNPGLLGSLENFRTRYAIPIERYGATEPAERLRTITRPYLLRRLKTDPRIIDDLPPKIEKKQYCPLTTEQASLYQAVVAEMLVKIESSTGIARRGNVLAAMAALKQVCNHPAQFLHDQSPLGRRSGKVNRVLEILGDILDSGEKVLCFTQYTEFAERLLPLLQDTFGREVLYLHGGTPKKRRDEMVRAFQEAVGPAAPAIFLLSLRAGGTGLTLTAANHVIHLDRWWNPAVENQATDRAFRIGQRRPVEVHKMICTGTLEEKIDGMLERKKALADSVIGDGEAWLTELSTAELAELFTLSGVGEDE